MSDKYKIVFLSSVASLAGVHIKQVLIPCSTSSVISWAMYATFFTATFLCLFFLIAEWRKAKASNRPNVIFITASCFIIISCLKDLYRSRSLTGQTLYFIALGLGIGLLIMALRRWKK